MKIVRRVLLALVVFFLLYTLYCLFSVPDLCDLKTKTPKTTAFQEQRKEQWEKQGVHKTIDRRWVPLSGISRNLRNAVMASEDPNFYHHHGLDYNAIWLGMKQDLKQGRIAVGASTITQQLMKNLYLSPSKNPLRKWREAILAVRVERCVPKDRILELYLNEIEWGQSIYGAETAARRYFGKSAGSLDPAESALLAAMIPNPIARNPYKRNTTLWRDKTDTLREMLQLGMISREQFEAALNQPIRLR